VLKARQQVLAGTPVTDDMFERVTITGDLDKMRALVVAAGDFTQAFSGKPLAQRLEPGQLLLLRSFDVSASDVRESLGPGQRAVSINVPDEAQAVAYSVRPGDAVDVWGWINDRAYLLKQGACVRAVGEGSNTSQEEGGGAQYRTVTFVIPEKDVEGLVSNLTLSGQNVRLSLMGPCDSKTEKPAAAAIPLPKERDGSAAPTPSAPKSPGGGKPALPEAEQPPAH